MTGVFGDDYAAAYDSLYREKDYDGECGLLRRLFHEHAQGPITSVLDLGCGTGGHAFPLAAHGFHVTGVDRSPAMIGHARTKARAIPDGAAVAPDFLHGDLCALDLGRTFDAAIMMFAVLGYQCRNDDLLATLRGVRRHLAPSGLFLFDVWYGPAVLAQRPGERVRFIEAGAERILRITRPDLDVRNQVCRVHFHVLRIADDRVAGETREEHPMRFFFAQDLDLVLSVCGLRLEALRAFPDADRDPDETTWNVIGVARAMP